MREIRLYGSEGGGAGRSPYPYQDPSKQSANRLRFKLIHCQTLDQLDGLSYSLLDPRSRKC